MLHPDPAADAFSNEMALAQLAYVTTSRAMATSLAENYAGLPFSATPR